MRFRRGGANLPSPVLLFYCPALPAATCRYPAPPPPATEPEPWATEAGRPQCTELILVKPWYDKKEKKSSSKNEGSFLSLWAEASNQTQTYTIALLELRVRHCWLPGSFVSSFVKKRNPPPFIHGPQKGKSPSLKEQKSRNRRKQDLKLRIAKTS